MYRWQISIWKILHIKQWDTTAHLLEWPKSSTLTRLNAGEDIKPQEFSYIAIGNTKWYIAFEKTVCQFLTKLLSLQSMLFGAYLKELKLYLHKTLFRADLFIISQTWKQSRRPSINEWINKLWHIQITEYFWGNFILFSLMEEELTFPPKVHKGSLIATSLPTVVCSCLFNNHSNRCAVISYCGFNLHSPDD